jgi:uncharacterized protein YjfI (DUF2170 family)
MTNIQVNVQKSTEFVEFLRTYGFDVEPLDSSVLKVSREGELPVYISVGEESLYFEVDLCPLSSLQVSEAFLYKLLDLNTEILPVSAGIDSSNPDDVRLVLVESREASNLDDTELLAVFDALELAVDRLEALLEENVKPGAV